MTFHTLWMFVYWQLLGGYASDRETVLHEFGLHAGRPVLQHEDKPEDVHILHVPFSWLLQCVYRPLSG